MSRPPAAWALATELSLDDVNVHLEALEAAGLLGVVEQHGRATVYVARRDDDLPVQGVWTAVEDRDWNAEWKSGLRPVRVGDVAVVAPWHECPRDVAVVLEIEPGQAFGTGHHETTTRCLHALQELDVAGAAVLDVGTGTGVLALAAAGLGARRVLAVDTDPLATAAATANAARNGLGIEVLAGSATAAGEERFDVVVANLSTHVVVTLAAELAQRVRPGGVLVVSGVSNERVDEAAVALEAAGLRVDASPGVEWAVLRGRR